jgi:hypothetical protein
MEGVTGNTSIVYVGSIREEPPRHEVSFEGVFGKRGHPWQLMECRVILGCPFKEGQHKFIEARMKTADQSRLGTFENGGKPCRLALLSWLFRLQRSGRC